MMPDDVEAPEFRGQKIFESWLIPVEKLPLNMSPKSI